MSNIVFILVGGVAFLQAGLRHSPGELGLGHGGSIGGCEEGSGHLADLANAGQLQRAQAPKGPPSHNQTIGQDVFYTPNVPALGVNAGKVRFALQGIGWVEAGQSSLQFPRSFLWGAGAP